MKIVPIERIPKKKSSKTDNFAILQEFIAMDVPSAEIQNPPLQERGDRRKQPNPIRQAFRFCCQGRICPRASVPAAAAR